MHRRLHTASFLALLLASASALAAPPEGKGKPAEPPAHGSFNAAIQGVQNSDDQSVLHQSVSEIPEPGGVALVAAGAVVVGLAVRRRRKG
ncbi:MAG: PEP-CTERM sorting domain-containing protein [Burkholderiales bacterium]|nr:PEP-CTERM sorting domain-containing protein [Burkholderiales bacterium]MBH2015618.1 PEP-CTERM sorting domain-containing protein [Burkholderiales bacterium]